MAGCRIVCGKALRKAKFLCLRRRRLWLRDKLDHPDELE
jgi:hypothetical protein